MLGIYNISIKWHLRRCQSSTCTATCGHLLTRDTCTCGHKLWCSRHYDSCRVAVVCCTSRLISDTHHQRRSTRLFATLWASADTGHPHVRVSLQWTWMTIVSIWLTRHLQQLSERVLICRAANRSKYGNHTQIWQLAITISYANF